ncbi:MAG TPA: hypothetical protein VL422_19265 [Miltoncostaea sp.]|nr:hypothetical protein [Miltoncostaea sp.]
MLTAVLIVVAVAAVLAAAAAVVVARTARAAAAAAEAGVAEAGARAQAAELRRRMLSDVVPLVALRLDAGGRLVEPNRVARERFPFLQPGMSVLEAFSEHTLAREVDDALADLAPREFEVRLFVDGRRTYRASGTSASRAPTAR